VISNVSYQSQDICFYCRSYNQMIGNYPENIAMYHFNDNTPRCQFHWQYQCFTCKNQVHFNGISWCYNCKIFSCISCSKEELVYETFFIYDYYYRIICTNCNTSLPCLDYAEYNATHPFQLGDLKPTENINIWIPIGVDITSSKYPPNTFQGRHRIMNLGKQIEKINLNLLNPISTKEVWDDLAEDWIKVMGDTGDLSHKYMILPDVMRFLELHLDDVVLDAGCGQGNLCRLISKEVQAVYGIEQSILLDEAKRLESINSKSINYIKGDILEIGSLYEHDFFDKVVMNMVLMDLQDYKGCMKNISNVLKPQGLFVISILHPVFANPPAMSIRIPNDSQRNEDRLWVIDDYFSRTAQKIFILSKPFIVFHRTISDYVNALIENGFIIEEMSEPQATEDYVKQHPRFFYLNETRKPNFLIIKARKK